MNTLRVMPVSRIVSWKGWPDDVRERLRGWNRERALTFTRIGFWGEQHVFQCSGCSEWHEPPVNGVAVLSGNAYCDLCLIVLCRSGFVPAGRSTDA